MTHVLDPDALPDDARALTAPLPPYNDVTRSDAAFRAFLHGLPGVDQVGAESRVADARHPLDQDDGEGLGDRHRDLDGRPDHAGGRRTPPARSAPRRQGPPPDPSDPSTPQVAAVCVYGDLAGVAREALGGSGIHVAAVATAFPSGRASRAVKLADVKDAVANGADEIDMVIDRGAFLAGRYLDVYEEIVAVKEACGSAAPQGHPRDRRAGHPRQRPPRQLAGDARRRRLHQDLHRQDLPRRDPAGLPRHARGGPRLPRRHRHARSASSPPAASGRRRTP